MPKVVDHEAYRREIALKSVDIFAEHGVNGLGMRGIAEALGISKSALYHYFPSKEALFEASTEAFLEPGSLYGLHPGETIPEDKKAMLTKLVTALDSRFRGELTLMLDYTKNKSHQQIEQDSLIELANQRFTQELAQIVGSDHADKAYALLFGGLTMRLLNGQQTDIESIVEWVFELAEEA
ncbi:TetR/AcrR family transcriptional regulator [Vibrio ulleungensis]|uniref:TetR/AcrR family transcriptional regulator n=1 Tax=Vibrio ulleungensis TaxID=2807619 RepID=A0ABS2HHV9_9VIBR|nr:TetR/AcrR family transcriptional regulator [Vibrio ulleungensis]MBM7035401.1 TetR/AcrR family transcriptional regulator [Vibrio ulleungensis]